MTAESQMFLAALAFHALCWWCLLLVRQDVRGRERRQREQLDAQLSRMQLRKWTGRDAC